MKHGGRSCLTSCLQLRSDSKDLPVTSHKEAELHTEGTMLLSGDRPCSDGGVGAVHVFHGEIVVLVPERQSSSGGGVYIKGDINPC